MVTMNVEDQEVVINKCYGGFGLSHAAVMKYAEFKGIELYGYVNPRSKNGSLNFDKYELYEPEKHKENSFCIHYRTKALEMGGLTKEAVKKGINENYFHVYDIARNDPDLVKAVRELGEDANGNHADLNILQIPAGVEWIIEEYDGIEWIAEKHRTWE